MPKTVGRFGVYSFAIFSLVLTGCPSPKQESVPKVPHPLAKPKDLRARPVRTEIQKKYDALDGLPLSLKQACAVDICGAIGDAPTASDIERGRVETSSESRAIFSDKISPKLDELELTELTSQRELLEKMRASQASLSQIKLSDKHRNLLNQLFMWMNLGSALRAKQSSTINATALQSLLPSMSSEDRESLVQYATIFINHPLYRDLEVFGQVGLDDALTATGKAKTRAELPQARVTYAKMLKAKIEKLSKAFPTLDLKASSAVLDLAKGKSIEKLAQEQVQGDISRAMMADFADNSAFNSRDPQVGSAIERFYSNVLPKQEAKLASSRDDRSKANAECQLSVDQIAAMDLTDNDIATFANLTEQVRKQAIKNAERLAPANAVEKVKNVIAAVDFNFPATSKDRVEYLVSRLDQSIESNRLRTASNLSADDLALFAAISADAGQDDETKSELSGIGSDCRDMRPEPISDYSLTGHGKINISWQTVKFAETGVGVLGHEFGHVTSNAISISAPFGDSVYKDTKSCTATRHGTQDGRTLSDEEDFADVFAADIVKLIDGKHTNLACALLGNTESRYGTESGLTLKKPTNSPDTHSTNFHRVIVQELDLGRPLSSSCQNVISQGLPDMKRTCSLN